MAASLGQALETAGLQEYTTTFKNADVDVEVFLFLTDNDLVELGIKVGPRRKLLNLQKQLREMQGIQFDDEDGDANGGDDDDEDEDDDGGSSSSSDEEITEEKNGAPVIFEKPHDEEKEARREQRKSMAKDAKDAKALAQLSLTSTPPPPAVAASSTTSSTQKPAAAAATEAQPKATTTPKPAAVAPAPSATIQMEYIKNKDKSSKMIKLATVPEINADEIEAADCQGWLWKEGGIIKSWKKRWCVLKGPCLYYFPTPSKTRAKGMITLPSYEITTAAEQVNKEFAFQAYHPSARTYIFVANNKHDMQHWINMMALATKLTAPLSAANVRTYFLLLLLLFLLFYILVFTLPFFCIQPGGIPVAVAGGVILPTVGTNPTSTVKPLNTPLPANAHVKFNIFDVRISRKMNEIIGLDIKVNRQNGTIVTKVHENSPAATSGMIQVGDQIVKIDGRSVAGMTAAMVVEIMRNLKENFVFSIRRL